MNGDTGPGGRDLYVGLLVGLAADQFGRQRRVVGDAHGAADEPRRCHRDHHHLRQVGPALTRSAHRPGGAHPLEQLLVGAVEPGVVAARQVAVAGEVAPAQLQAVHVVIVQNVIFQDAPPSVL